MSDLTAFGLLFYFLSIIAIVVLATLANGQVRTARQRFESSAGTSDKSIKLDLDKE